VTLHRAMEALCNLQASLRITHPHVAQIKVAYALPPARRQSGLPDVPCWINVWGLTQVLNWGQVRVERYTITSQLLVQDADTTVAAEIATAFATQFLEAWDEIDGDLDGQTVGTELRARDPTIVTMEWGGLAYQGCQFMIEIDVPVIATPDYDDDVIATLQNWTARYMPTWQQDPAVWRPTDARPAIYWHRVTIQGPAFGGSAFLGFDASWDGCQVAARIAAPSRIARTNATIYLTDMLSRTQEDGMIMPDGSTMQYDNTRADPGIIPNAEGQVMLDVKFFSDDSLPDIDNDGDWCQDLLTGALPINPAVLNWKEEDSEGYLLAAGPTIYVYGPPVPEFDVEGVVIAQGTTEGHLHIEFTEGATL
jgi:hypothetical protein